jgi:putative redox protein
MNTSKIIYLGDLRTNATHLASNNTIVTDAPVDNHGKGEAFSPTDLMATSLGACLMTVVGIHAEQNEIDMKGSEVQIQKIMSNEGPRRIVKINVNITFKTSDPLNEKQRIIFERIAKTCPVALSLHPDIEQNIMIEFVN